MSLRGILKALRVVAPFCFGLFFGRPLFARARVALFVVRCLRALASRCRGRLSFFCRFSSFAFLSFVGSRAFGWTHGLLYVGAG